MDAIALEEAARIACLAADRARDETLSRFRSVEVETKADGSPVTEADRAAERVIREVLRGAYPDFGLLGEEYGAESVVGPPSLERATTPVWVIDPIDGTIAYSRGLRLYATLIALVEDGQAVLGLIDLPALDERYLGWRGGGCRRNGESVEVSGESDLQRALISHGDPMCFDRANQRPAFERLAREVPMLRGYTDAFGHAQVLSGGVDAMVDVDLNTWDAAASQILVTEAGGRWSSRRQANGKIDLVLGSPPLVEQLSAWLEG
jgi:histidinol phosphatase-like enzyme (inositol monophosphatase family)